MFFIVFRHSLNELSSADILLNHNAQDKGAKANDRFEAKTTENPNQDSFTQINHLMIQYESDYMQNSTEPTKDSSPTPEYLPTSNEISSSVAYQAYIYTALAMCCIIFLSYFIYRFFCLHKTSKRNEDTEDIEDHMLDGEEHEVIVDNI
ncbi:hypothetical protein TVAG_295520 [Trichomonas vaginalis G3]|uniref:Uncharacterized protein n=1 Tax=Trichomonas vaginalis (strain ATCC PRA-98 / G3) TaxID=412133 RepID=A2F219_TRIV3|nr:hypothetical protein TVAGG3_0971440 [Trichomonas vaginalis G3]EAY01018.1 hypothetical protein TVAG_295520 [Trichomonas vaginalis G3]KAI5488613.1 hypothetical protein TVAGG3_0971440 [Trichomonas vaginalis G3]|eukprot:XP_001313904.1 hypothetical protein [Trichomonas vaginalis G3]